MKPLGSMAPICSFSFTPEVWRTSAKKKTNQIELLSRSGSSFILSLCTGDLMSIERIQTVISQKGRKIVGRLLPDMELIKGIEEVCRYHDVAYGGILAVIGSLKEAKIVYVIPDEVGKIGIRYKSPARIEGPLELLACQGMVGRTAEGKSAVHLHGLMSNPEMAVF